MWIKDMFWQLADETIPSTAADLFELAKQVRSKDDWHNVVLAANRLGRETWEMYCFTHGLPTVHVGSWLPNSDIPQCGNHSCRDLDAIWNEM